MNHHAFRILGLDTSFTKPEETRVPDGTRKTTYDSLQTIKIRSDIQQEASELEPRVTVRLADLLPLLIDASQKNLAWIRDFGDDTVNVSQDLYEVALAYRSMNRAA